MYLLSTVLLYTTKKMLVVHHPVLVEYCTFVYNILFKE